MFNKTCVAYARVAVGVGCSLFLLGCGRKSTLVNVTSADGRGTVRISEEIGWGCGSDACVSVEIAQGGSTKAIYNDHGWRVCFAAGAWAPDSKSVAIVASNCYGPFIAFSYDIASGKRMEIGPHAEYIKRQLENEYAIPKSTDLLTWIRSEEARTKFSVRRQK